MLTTNESKSTTFTPNQDSIVSMGSVDNKLTESTLTIRIIIIIIYNRLQIGYAVGVAVGGLLMVFVVVAVIVITLLVVKKGQAQKILEGEESLASSPDHKDIKVTPQFLA